MELGLVVWWNSLFGSPLSVSKSRYDVIREVRRHGKAAHRACTACLFCVLFLSLLGSWAVSWGPLAAVLAGCGQEGTSARDQRGGERRQEVCPHSLPSFGPLLATPDPPWWHHPPPCLQLSAVSPTGPHFHFLYLQGVVTPHWCWALRPPTSPWVLVNLPHHGRSSVAFQLKSMCPSELKSLSCVTGIN